MLTASLGNWQLNRASERLLAQAERDALNARGPVPVNNRTLDAGIQPGGPVTATGHWVPDRTIYLDNRTHERQAGFHVFTPLRLSGISGPPVDVLVLRGWAPRHVRDRTLLPPVPEPDGEVTITGIAEADITQTMQLANAEPPGPRDRLWQQASLQTYAQWSGLSLAPLLIRQTGSATDEKPGAAGPLIRDWITPGSKVDKHYGYAFQWFTMSAAMLGFWVWLTFIRPRRRRVTEQ